MPTIQVAEQTFTDLQRLAEPLVDTPDTVIQRLIREHEKKGVRPARPRRRRAKKGEKTPNQAFYGPILKALREAGGSMPAGEAVDRVGELMGDRLKDLDHEPVKSSGELRWRNTVRFARSDLVKQGKLAKDSPFGIWEIADEQRD